MLKPKPRPQDSHALSARDSYLDALAHTPELLRIGAVHVGLEAASHATDAFDFYCALRQHQVAMREAILESRNRLPRNAPSREARPGSSLAHALKDELGDAQLGLVEHAARMVARALDVASLLPEGDFNDEALGCRSDADDALWLHLFAWAYLWRVPTSVAGDSPSVEHAVRLAVDQAREAYAYSACALDLQEKGL